MAKVIAIPFDAFVVVLPPEAGSLTRWGNPACPVSTACSQVVGSSSRSDTNKTR